jgi:hypothetical protein
VSFVPKKRSALGRRGQGGYAMLMVLFLATLMLLGTMAVAPNLLTEGTRDREQEMIWRGKQYTRGIKLYYRKTGKFPTSMEDLTKPKIGTIRFMRQAYKDPMNPKDGEWRLIYVGPAGQLIGSLKPKRALQLSMFGGVQNIAAPTMGGVPGASSAPPIGQPFGQTGLQPAGGAGTLFSAGGQNEPPSGEIEAPVADDAANQALLAADPPQVMGGNIIGVGSKINHPSVLVYDKAKNYRQFEFIWDPSKDAITVGGAPGLGPQPALPGAQPASSSPFPAGGANAPITPAEPEPQPPDTTPNPPQP